MVCQNFDPDEEKATNIQSLTTKVGIQHCFKGAVGVKGLPKRCHVTVCCYRCGGCSFFLLNYCQKEAPLIMAFLVRQFIPSQLKEI